MVSSYEDYKRSGYEDYFDGPQYGEPHQSSGGAWFIRESDREFLSLIRVTGPKDESYRERTEYNSDCGACWLGHAHSGDYHRAYLGMAVASPATPVTAPCIRCGEVQEWTRAPFDHETC